MCEGHHAARVLVGEPHAELRSLLERVLGELGHVAVSPRGDWRDNLPAVDVLVLAPSLADGPELARALREANPELPVIYTSSGPPGSWVKELEPVAHLVKPFAVADLERALRDAVGRAVAATRRLPASP